MIVSGAKIFLSARVKAGATGFLFYGVFPPTRFPPKSGVVDKGSGGVRERQELLQIGIL